MTSLQKHSVYLLLLCVLSLAAAGLLMLASTGAYATDGTAEGMGALKRQCAYVIIGVIAASAISLLDYRHWERFFPWIFGGTLALLALCYVPGVGKEINGENRWVDFRAIGLAGIRLQPSELGKLSALLFMAWWYARAPLRVAEFMKGYAMPWAVLGVIICLIAFERDLGTAALLVAVCLLVMFVVGVRLVFLGLTAAAGAAALVTAVRFIPERLDRWMAFLDLEANRYGEGLQQWRAQIALGSGGFSGRGFGNGIEKLFYMPYAHTDFIFPMIGEEFGLAGTLTIIMLFSLFVVCGMSIASSAPDMFGRVLGTGIVAMIGCQALVNMGVTTALLPNKGLPLPFISYGGSSVVVMFMMIGVLINIHRQGLSHDNPNRGLSLGMPVITPRL